MKELSIYKSASDGGALATICERDEKLQPSAAAC
jgi:hypothetical protein